MSPATVPIVISVAIFALWIRSGFKFARDYERLVVLRLGRVAAVRGPGLTFVFEPVEKAFRIDLRATALRVSERTFKTVDSRGVRYNAEMSWIRFSVSCECNRFLMLSRPAQSNGSKPLPLVLDWAISRLENGI